MKNRLSAHVTLNDPSAFRLDAIEKVSGGWFVAVELSENVYLSVSDPDVAAKLAGLLSDAAELLLERGA